MKDCVELLLEWYQEHKRLLPWRVDKDPYHVWISEIMLQQTRIEAVLSYYQRFMKSLPSIQALSEISEDELLKLWEGLGYYSRARNLKKAACIIIDQYHGVFPSTYSDILGLPGIGEYTAGAIASICFQQKEVAVDGNVMRVYCRVMDHDINIKDLKVKKQIANSLKKILPENSGDYNQAIMELGEVICIPSGIPKCHICPLQYHCKAHLNGREALIPRKIQKNEKLEEEYTVFLLKWKQKYAIRKRKSGLLKNLWEFPNQTGFFTYEEVKKLYPNCNHIELGITNTHIFTHKKWFMNSYYVEIPFPLDDYLWVSLEEIASTYAIPTAFMPFYQYLKEK